MADYFREEDHPWVKGLNFQEISAEDLLRYEREKTVFSSKKKLWVLDLDSTLFCVSPRTQRIFLEFLRQHPCPEAEWHRLLMRLRSSTLRYELDRSFAHLFEVAGCASQEAEKKGAALWREFEAYWREHFFSEKYLHWDEAYPGATDFVCRILEQGAEVAYLTARDRPRTGSGTWQALKGAGFPLTESTHLLMKSAVEESDLDFKKRAASVLRSSFEVQVYIDNEPENLVMAAREFPQAEIVFFHTVMSPRVPEEDYQRLLNGRQAWRLKNYSLGQQ